MSLKLGGKNGEIKYEEREHIVEDKTDIQNRLEGG